MVEVGAGIQLDMIDDKPSVADILSSIDGPEGMLADGRFEREISGLLDLIDYERAEQGIQPYDYNQRVILVHEAYRVALRYKDKRRKSKDKPEAEREPVFYDHLMGSTRVLVSEIGLTGVGSIIAMLNHDTVEDFSKDEDGVELKGRVKKDKQRQLSRTLIDVDFYKGKLRNYNPEEAVKIEAEVKLIVEGVTKVRKATKEKTLDATIAQLLGVTRSSVRSVFIKLADRLHNLRTLSGHGADESGMAKQKDIIDDTEDIYLPLARIVGARNIVREYVDIIVNFRNPELVRDFKLLQRRRLSERLDPYKDYLYNKLIARPCVKDIEFVSRELDYYMYRVSGSTGTMTFEDLNVGVLDPMFDVIITTTDYEKLSLDEIAKISKMPYEEADERVEKDCKVLAMEEARRFARDTGFMVLQVITGMDDKVQFSYETPRDGKSMKGIEVHIFNNKLGGHLHVRVNDAMHQRRQNRGIAAGFLEKAPPEYMRRMITDILNRTLAKDTGQAGIVEGARREFLKSRIMVYTRNGDALYLPRGATGLDFAAAVHGDLLVGAQKLVVKDRLNSDDEEVEVSLFDPLEHGKAYQVVTCLSGDEKDYSMVKVTPAWLARCQGGARNRLRKVLSKPYCPYGPGTRAEVIRNVGENYVAECAKLLGTTEKVLMILLDRTYRPLKKDVPESGGEARIPDEALASRRTDIFTAVGKADPIRNPLAAFANRCDQRADRVEEKPSRKIWEIVIRAPHKPKQLKRIVSEFSSGSAINIEKVVTRNLVKNRAKVIVQFDLESQGIGVFEFFQMLMGLKMKYPETVISKNPYVPKERPARSRRFKHASARRVMDRAQRSFRRNVNAAAAASAELRVIEDDILENERTLARELGIERVVCLDDPEVLRVFFQSTVARIEEGQVDLGNLRRRILAADPDLAIELGIIDDDPVV